MLGVDDYGSDSDSDAGAPTSAPTTEQKQTEVPVVPKSTGGLNLPAPKKSGKRRDGPVRITVDLPKPKTSDDDDDSKPAPNVERPIGGPKSKGAGASSLLSMLPKPKQAVPTLPKPKPVRVLGGGASNGDDPGVIMPSESFDFEPLSFGGSKDEETSTMASTSFVPMSTTRPKPKGASSSAQPPKTTKPAPAPAIDFFSLGSLHSVACL